MNSLSWLIYLADIVGSFGSLLTFSLVASVVVGAISALFGVWSDTCAPNGYSGETAEAKISLRKKVFSLSTRLYFKYVPIIMAALIIIPTQQTVMMIAASQFGEDIATSAKAEEMGNKAYTALDQFLSQYIEDQTKQVEGTE